jgi:hypothetical protein
MAIFKHPDGGFRRYPPSPSTSTPTTVSADEYTNPAHWRPVPGARPGVEIHRDGKTMRNRPTGS